MDTAEAYEKDIAWCYRFRFDDGEVLYVGTTVDPVNRLKYHKPYWHIEEPLNVDIMQTTFQNRFDIEAVLINRYMPVWNRKIPSCDPRYLNIHEAWRRFARVYPNNKTKMGEVEYWED